MTLQQQISEDIKTAMKNKQPVLLNVLRQLKNALTNAALHGGNASAELSDLEVIAVVRKQIAQRQDSIEAAKKANREDMVSSETEEIECLKPYLPKELTDEQVEGFIELAIVELQATSKKDMGKVIKRVAEMVNGGADNKRISQKVSAILK